VSLLVLVTHNILQATINKLCELNSSFAAFVVTVNNTYVKLSDLNSLIAAYLSGQSAATKYYTRMVPYTVVEYYGTLSGNFDASGAGLGYFEKKSTLCNGNNSTP
jgi:hypothetical protein